MSYTKKYYILSLINAPIYGLILFTSKLSPFIYLPLSAVSLILSIQAGYYLGKREANPSP